MIVSFFKIDYYVATETMHYITNCPRCYMIFFAATIVCIFIGLLAEDNIECLVQQYLQNSV